MPSLPCAIGCFDGMLPTARGCCLCRGTLSSNAPSTSPILGQPSVNRMTVNPQGSRDNLEIFASLNATHGMDTHRSQHSATQFASVVSFQPYPNHTKLVTSRKKVTAQVGLLSDKKPRVFTKLARSRVRSPRMFHPCCLAVERRRNLGYRGNHGSSLIKDSSNLAC